MSPQKEKTDKLMPELLGYQVRYLTDPARMILVEKSRQIGFSWTSAYRQVLRASHPKAVHDVWVSSRDNLQADIFVKDCLMWADQQLPPGHAEIDWKLTKTAAIYFVNGRVIHSLSSNPNALAGKHGHVVLDEFALHQDQRLLYRVAKPVIQWGGSLEIISTHRGVDSLFNEWIKACAVGVSAIKWSLHSVTLQKAVEDGLVEKINEASGEFERREEFLKRTRAECVDEQQWLQEYCCVPVGDNAETVAPWVRVIL